MIIFKPRLFILLIIILCLIEILGVGYITLWREWFWTSVSQKNINQFFILISYFSIVALILCLVSGLEGYYISKLSLHVRYKLTRKSLSVLSKLSTTEGYAQRIQEDCLNYPLIGISLLKNIIVNFIMFFFYVYVIYRQIGYIYILLPILYGIIGTGLGGWVAHPLISLNYLNQVKEAAFRKLLSKLNYAKVHRNNHLMFKKQKHLTYFQYFYGQISVIFPYLLLASLYFSGKITFGVLMQCSASISSLVESMSIFLNSFGDINRWLSCRRRLRELGII